MKSTKIVRNFLLSAAFAVLTVLSAMSSRASLQPLTTSDVMTTAGGDVKKAIATYKAFKSLAATPSSPMYITLTHIILPSVNTPELTAAQDRVIADARAGTLPSVRTNLTDPNSYTICGGMIVEANLVYSLTTPEKDGQLNPLAPFMDYQGNVEWCLVHAKSASGQDDISMDQIVLTVTSTGGLLDGTITFNGLSYTPRAIGIRADGSTIMKGDASQKCTEVYVMASSKKFNGGGTQGGLTQVFTYVGSFTNPPYSLTYTAVGNGDSTTTSVSIVSIGGLTNNPVGGFVLTIKTDGSVAVTNGVAGQTYNIQKAPTVPGPWTTIGNTMGTNSMTNSLAGSMSFYRALQQ